MVAEEDHMQEMDWRQLWLQEGDMNTRIFHLMANDHWRTNQLLRLTVRDHEYARTQAIGQAIIDHFGTFIHRGNRIGGNGW